MDIQKVSDVIHKLAASSLIALIAFWLLAVTSLPSRGQDRVRAALVGSVCGLSGAAVPGASITLQHLTTNQNDLEFCRA